MSTLEIVTTSHIDTDHAEGPDFPEATSADGRFSWHHGAPGYVAIRCEGTGLTDNTMGKIGYHVVYLQHGALDPEVSAELLEEARAFSCAVDEEQDRRERAQETVAAAIKTPALSVRDQALLARYRTSEAAWDAEDEEAWARLRQLEH